ncbi:MAG: 2-C-methyl-D-erythritol 4-phosphate cytidylyltransferase [Nocardioidaceae bacterium]
MHSVTAIIPAAGDGSRLAADESVAGPAKALRRLGADTLIRHAIRSLEHAVDRVVVATSTDLLTILAAELSDVPIPVDVVEGGPTRQESVRLALKSVGASAEFVLVHDAARPLVPVEVTDRVLAALRAGAGAVVPVVPVVDTLRRRDADGSSNLVDRTSIRAVQTPQGFPVEVLRRAHAADGAEALAATDDASLAENIGVAVVLVDGDPAGFKVTRLLDLRVAELMVTSVPPQR